MTDTTGDDDVSEPADVVVAVRDGGVVIDGRPILRGIDLEVRQGETVAILGANGSGKSTLVRAMLGLTPLAHGEVELFGTPLARFHERWRIGFVPQRVAIAGGVPASVWEVVGTGRLARRRPWMPPSRADRVAVRRALAGVQLSDRLHDSIATLSGGQQQRVLIARALAGEADLLVLDEPTAGVDLPTQQTLADILQALSRRGATIVLVAHEMGPLEGLIDRTVVMSDGRVSYDGAPLANFHEAAHHHGHHHPDLEPPPGPRVTESLDVTPRGRA